MSQQPQQTDQDQSCLLCQGTDADAVLERIPVWEDDHWRLTMSLAAEVPGFSYLEPHRHIPDITHLDGEAARTLGPVLARITRALREETRARQVYIYVFGGGIPHLHLAPHRPGDALNDRIIRGELEVEKLSHGAERLVSRDFPLLPEADQRALAHRVRQRLQ